MLHEHHVPKLQTLTLQQSCRILGKTVTYSDWSILAIRSTFIAVNTTLVNFHKEVRNPKKLDTLAQALGKAEFTTNAELLVPFEIDAYLQKLRKCVESYETKDHLHPDCLYLYLRVTKTGWELYRERNFKPELFVPKERFYLAVILRTALRLPEPEAVA